MAAAIPYALLAGGTLAQMKANEDVADKQRSIVNAQLQRNDETAAQNNQQVLDQAKQIYDPTARQQSIDAETQRVNDQQQADLKAGAGGGTVGTVNTAGDAGNVSDDFLKAKAGRAITEGTRLTDLARSIAKSRAIGGVQKTEGQQNADLYSNLNDLNSTNRNYAAASQTDASNVRPGALGTLGSLASAIGTATALGGTGGISSLFGGGNAAAGLGAADTLTDTTGYGFKANPLKAGVGARIPAGINWGAA